jgi:SpoVK/Ycf46/Vps4 family AAA+-type ATPase
MLMGSKLGESEQKLKEALKTAEAMAPCILWADEFDKAMAGNSSSESDGGTSARMLGYFLRWLIESKSQVFVAATANRPWGFKPELLRRFQMVYVDLPNKSARNQIWKVQLGKYKVKLSDQEIATLAAESDGYTGDEIGKVANQCAAVAYGQRRPGQVSVAELLNQLRSKQPQFAGNAELKELRDWTRAGGAMFAAPDPATERTSVSSWSGERNVNFSNFTEFGETEIS